MAVAEGEPKRISCHFFRRTEKKIKDTKVLTQENGDKTSLQKRHEKGLSDNLEYAINKEKKISMRLG